jgi:DNA-binding NtrC family response regulator
MSCRIKSDLRVQISNLKFHLAELKTPIFETRIVIEMVALSDAMREVMGLAERVATTDANVLVTGESGAGKDALAGFIHSRSPRASLALVKIDCATLPADLIEAELFGYERGAFTGATEAKPGRLEAARGSTLVLDEIAHLPLDAQAKLLRVIEHRQFERLGGRQTIEVDARLVALTNTDLKDAVERRAFRDDLFYRLNVVQIQLPPLRERSADLDELSSVFLRAFAAKHGRTAKAFTAEAKEFLRNYDFPGNVRELANIIERAVIVSAHAQIEAEDLPESTRLAAVQRKRKSERPTLATVEAEYIRETLAATKGNKTEAARILGISRKNLYERLAREKAGDQRSEVSGQKSAVSDQMAEIAEADGGELMSNNAENTRTDL